MKFRFQSRRFRLSLVALAALSAAIPSQAEVTNSANFSLGYGYCCGPLVPPLDTWGTNETASANTLTNIGAFGFAPHVTGSKFSGNGPRFVGRVLSNGAYDSYASGRSSNFNVSVTGSFNDPLPPNATNLQMTLNITSISIYGLNYSPNGTPRHMSFQETTPGHAATSPSVLLKDVSWSGNPTPSNVASNWTQLVWNPVDFIVAGSSSTRTFNLGSFSNSGYGVDAFEITGYLFFTYDVPEPSSVVLLGLGCLLLRKRR